MLGHTASTTIQNVMGAISATVDDHASKVVTARQPASAYVTLNSRDRYFDSSPTQTRAVFQPWNNFILQKAEALIPGYSRRIAITEVRFPWSIPNITLDNCQFGIILDDGVPTSRTIDILPDVFYTPTQLATAISASINTILTAAGVAPGDIPTCAYSNGCFEFLPGANNTDFALVAVTPNVGAIPLPQTTITSSLDYLNAPNLLATLAMSFELLTTNLAAPSFALDYRSNLSFGLYTDYVDIVSQKLMRFADARDSSSGNLAQTSTVMRLYLADEVSLTTTDMSGNPVPPGCAPFVIHRQFQTPKQVLCDPDSFVGDLDISVYDMFGRLVYLKQDLALNRPFSYPEFQITLLASED